VEINGYTIEPGADLQGADLTLTGVADDAVAPVLRRRLRAAEASLSPKST
jgi:hypothetical protein